LEEFRIFFDDAYEWLVDDGLVVIPGYNKSSIIAKPFMKNENIQNVCILKNTQ
jgi:hypothetical protein